MKLLYFFCFIGLLTISSLKAQTIIFNNVEFETSTLCDDNFQTVVSFEIFWDGNLEDLEVTLTNNLNPYYFDFTFNPLLDNVNTVGNTYYFETVASYYLPIGNNNFYFAANDANNPLIGDTILHNFDMAVAPNITTTNPIDSVCKNDPLVDLSLSVSPSGGSFYLYDMNYINNLIINETLFDPSIDYSNYLAPETDIEYIYTDPVSGCSSYYFIGLPVIHEAPEVNVSSNPASCGSNDGELFATITGGMTPYDVLWSTGNTNLTIANLSAGIYDLTVTDARGCKRDVSSSVSNSGITYTDNSIPPTCWYDKGTIDFSINSASPYEVYWNFGSTAEVINNMNPGVYIAEVTNDDGCVAYLTADLTPLSPPIVIGSLYSMSETCSGGVGSGDGYAEIETYGGGFGTLSILWDDNVTTTEDISSLNAGVHSVTITDANGCFIIDSVYIGSYNSSTGNWSFIDLVTPSTCSADGGVELYVSDPLEVSSYQWSNGATTKNITNVPSGVYTVNITDNDGCQTTLLADVPPVKPLLNPICMITVDSIYTTNLVVWEREETVNISGYNIYREEGPNNYNWIAFVPYTAESEFLDTTASPMIKSWSYRISAVNSCGVEGILSTPHKTSQLKTTTDGTDYILYWNDYQGFDISTNGIDVYRYTDLDNQWVMVGNVGSGISTFTDNTVIAPAGIEYYLDFIPPSACNTTKAKTYNSTRSNRTGGIFSPPADTTGSGGNNNNIESFKKATISIYPNPTKEKINVSLHNIEIDESTTFLLKDINGKLIENRAISQTTFTIEMNVLESGVYILSILSENHNYTKRIIKN